MRQALCQNFSSSLLLSVFGGRVKDLETVLIEERLPEGWESRELRPMGLTVASFNSMALEIEMSVDEEKYKETLSGGSQKDLKDLEAGEH